MTSKTPHPPLPPPATPPRDADASPSNPASRLRDAVRQAARLRRVEPLRNVNTAHRLQEPAAAASVSVFLAYSHQDDAIASALRALLIAEGVEVHSDHDFVGGLAFEKRIRQLIAETRRTIALWTPISIDSDYVIGEAKLAMRNNKLVCVHTDGLDRHDIPLDFNRLNSVALSDFARILRSLR